jgi:cell division transport system ATP-binding protein
MDTSWEMMDLFSDIAAAGTAVLIATHNVEIVKRFQRRVVTLVQGRLVRDQPAGRTGGMAWLASS